MGRTCLTGYEGKTPASRWVNCLSPFLGLSPWDTHTLLHPLCPPRPTPRTVFPQPVSTTLYLSLNVLKVLGCLGKGSADSRVDSSVTQQIVGTEVAPATWGHLMAPEHQFPVSTQPSPTTLPVLPFLTAPPNQSESPHSSNSAGPRVPRLIHLSSLQCPLLTSCVPSMYLWSEAGGPQLLTPAFSALCSSCVLTALIGSEPTAPLRWFVVCFPPGDKMLCGQEAALCSVPMPGT